MYAAVCGYEAEAKSETKRAPCIEPPPPIFGWLCGV